ncbi:MAG: glycoside hydrolase family 127 protein [Verrucomicrobia bacterium]|nr:glycoside hydrolase family 127 protein [Verrucomicrobiota bacterium]
MALVTLAVPLAAKTVQPKGAELFHSMAASRWHFGGVVGPRLDANLEQWLLRAPEANPALTEMFRLRDRLPVPKLTPWAGEFAGKYLISCVQALRLCDRADLRAHTARFVAELIGTQAADGYLGPFPKSERLLGHWDLWGHYHVMQGLLLWHDFSGDAAALASVRRAADLICRTYLDGAHRVFDAGSQEMNMAVAHVLAELHRRTGEPRYLTMTGEIVKDWERAGDYLRTGVAGMPFYKTPRPRWESLHDLQALAELWRITGEARYRDAFTSHWRTIREFDRRNTGAFSGGEKATGNAFAPSAIETCCTVAWMALSCDMLRLTGDPRVADELELSTFNAALGAQHPSGRWWTYNTPMDSERKASAHDIVFQARAGSPELNCCSVNGPRSLGMLSDWAVMRDERGLVVNWLGPMEMTTKDSAGGTVTLRCETDYPLDGRIVWRITSARPMRVRFRVPAWAEGASARVAGKTVPVKPGSYLEAERTWRDADTVELHLPLPLRTFEGQREQQGKVSLYRGPLLLAYDQRDNAFDEAGIPSIEPARLTEAKLLPLREPVGKPRAPWLLLELPTAKGPLRLRDFASAGASGTRYRSWLRVAGHEAPVGPDALVVSASLKGDAKPQFGQLLNATGFVATADGKAISLNGRDGMIIYGLPENFGADFTVAVRVRVRELPPAKQIGQVFSAWCAFMDDPLRLTVDHGTLAARIEAGRSYSTAGVPLAAGEWHHIAAVKAGTKLTLYVDGVARASAEAPAVVSTQSRAFALGGNPAYTGAPEFLAADFTDLLVRNRALSAAEVAALTHP